MNAIPYTSFQKGVPLASKQDGDTRQKKHRFLLTGSSSYNKCLALRWHATPKIYILHAIEKMRDINGKNLSVNTKIIDNAYMFAVSLIEGINNLWMTFLLVVCKRRRLCCACAWVKISSRNTPFVFEPASEFL